MTLTRLGTMKKTRIEGFKQDLEEYKYEFLVDFGIWFRKWRCEGGENILQDLDYNIWDNWVFEIDEIRENGIRFDEKVKE